MHSPWRSSSAATAKRAICRVLADFVRHAAQIELPLICHIYPRTFIGSAPQISYEPEDIAWAVHCAYEMGADVVKVPYCGDLAAHTQIVSDCPVPVVAAGGPKTSTQEEALAMMADVVRSGARRNHRAQHLGLRRDHRLCERLQSGDP